MTTQKQKSPGIHIHHSSINHPRRWATTGGISTINICYRIILFSRLHSQISHNQSKGFHYSFENTQVALGLFPIRSAIMNVVTQQYTGKKNVRK